MLSGARDVLRLQQFEIEPGLACRIGDEARPAIARERSAVAGSMIASTAACGSVAGRARLRRTTATAAPAPS